MTDIQSQDGPMVISPGATCAFDEVALRLHRSDNVAVARRQIPAGAEIRADQRIWPISHPVPTYHKFALDGIRAGDPIIKYGQTIGFATADIFPGDHVHSHNLAMKDFGRDYAFCADARPLIPVSASEQREFMGYRRADGRVGTRNYIAVVSSVNCSASVCRYVADRFRDVQRDYPNVDGVLAITHKTGCCMTPGKATDVLQRTLAGFAKHPNVFGYVMIGLGCEGNQLQDMADGYQLAPTADADADPSPTMLVIQETGGIAKTVDAAAEAVERLLPRANAVKRTAHPASKLVLAEQCGGSDANSGITANPAVGVAGDMLVRQGGTAVLAETPEIYGAEHLLTRRAVSEAVGRRLVDLVHWWEEHAAMHGASIDNNPTPGNKQGGLTTIYEKSLGAVAKAGQAPLAAVYEYAQPIDTPGLGFMDSPGYDPVSMTGMVAGGATVGVFTTGRGSCYGCKPMPTIKIATNSTMYHRMADDMDLNAGRILDGAATIEQVGGELFDLMLRVGSGEKTKSEAQGIGDEEFAPWPLGATF